MERVGFTCRIVFTSVENVTFKKYFNYCNDIFTWCGFGSGYWAHWLCCELSWHICRWWQSSIEFIWRTQPVGRSRSHGSTLRRIEYSVKKTKIFCYQFSQHFQRSNSSIIYFYFETFCEPHQLHHLPLLFLF